MNIRKSHSFGKFEAISEIFFGFGRIADYYIRRYGGVGEISPYKRTLIGKLPARIVPVHTLQDFVRPRLQRQMEMQSEIFQASKALKKLFVYDVYFERTEPYSAIDGNKCVYKRVSVVNEYISPPADETIKTVDLKVGESKTEVYSKRGAKSSAYIEKYRNGKLVGKVRLSEDYYKPVRGVIYIGIGDG